MGRRPLSGLVFHQATWRHEQALKSLLPLGINFLGDRRNVNASTLGCLFPFHSWSPDGHVAAPTAVSMFHAGVLMKLGAFAALRVGIMLMPEGVKFWSPLILGLATVNVVYGALIAMVQIRGKQFSLSAQAVVSVQLESSWPNMRG